MNRHMNKGLALLALSVILSAILLLTVAPILAQDGGGQPKVTVTADDVNAVARKLYCPVCENIPLDTCGTLACAQWRDEIRIQLEEGRTPQQVIDDFVARFGERVVGTPQDPTLRLLSLLTPWAVTGLAAIGAVLIFMRWRGEQVRSRGRPAVATAGVNSTIEVPTGRTEAEYRARVEADLAARR